MGEKNEYTNESYSLEFKIAERQDDRPLLQTIFQTCAEIL